MIPYGLPLANKQVSPSLWIEKNYYTEAFHWIERRRWLFKNTLILGDGTWIHLSQEIGLGYIYPRRWDLDTSIPWDGTWIHLSQKMGLEGYIYPRGWDLKDTGTSIRRDGIWKIHLFQEMGFAGCCYQLGSVEDCSFNCFERGATCEVLPLVMRCIICMSEEAKN